MTEIRSLSDYINYLDTLQSTYPMQRYIVPSTFFRGQADKDWKLSPKLYREGLIKMEGAMIKEVMHLSPEEFEMDRFDVLAKLQHYGFPTRLLDATSNPLVALYFACTGKNESEKDGAVYVFPNLPASWSDDTLVEIIMDYVFEYTPDNLCLEDFLQEVKLKYKSAAGRAMPESIDLLMHYLKIPALAVVPKRSNARLAAQDGAFFLFGMKPLAKKVSDNPGTYGKEYYSFGPVEIESHRDMWHLSDKLIVPSDCKEKILVQLDTLGVNEQRLFPDIEHQLKYVWEKYAVTLQDKGV